MQNVTKNLKDKYVRFRSKNLFNIISPMFLSLFVRFYRWAIDLPWFFDVNKHRPVNFALDS